MHYKFAFPEASRDEFGKVVDEVILKFEQTSSLKKLRAGDFGIADYHRLLVELFHQVYNSSGSFALAAAHMSADKESARSYLIKHAEEEQEHWKWIINDLRNTGFQGISPLQTLPPPKALAYVSLNYYLSTKMPISRLGIALMLESVGANFGEKYGSTLVEMLKLDRTKVSFFLGHGNTDVGHTADLWRVLENCSISPQEWAWMCAATRTAGQLYCDFYAL